MERRNNNGNYKNNYTRRYEEDKGEKKDFRRRTTHQKNGLPKNMHVEIPVSCYRITKNGIDYNGVSFISMMEDLQANNTFSKISIPVYIPASYVNEDPTAKWNIVVGYIKGFNPDTGDATIIIYAKSIKNYQKLTQPIIVPRVALKDSEVTCIIGLDIIEESDIKK